MPKIDPETQKLYDEINGMIQKFKDDQKSKADCTLADKCGDMGDVPKIRLSSKKILKGHINKVNSVHFAGDSRHCVTGSLDGKLIIWDTWTANKVQIIPLRSAWVMTVAFSPSGNFVACGGMDNQCTVYDVNNRDASGVAKMVKELMGYEGFLSSCRFLDDGHLITGSGDMKICHWDLEKGVKTMDFNGHAGDIAGLSLSPDMKTYITGSVDKTAKLWDVREEGHKQMFFGHDMDVSSVCYHPNGLGFASCSEDQTARMYDLRADQQIALYEPPQKNTGFTSCALSTSGRYLMCGGIEGNVHSWDTMKQRHTGTLSGHENRITCISLCPNGMCLASTSWDQQVRLWL
ncbi:guanine nucleotide-binding protein subunit beta-2 [Drosophila subpulchrella]|uniref:guanine nucleotide-binding protein subunit beta-2 n=1 Tax=Drosophila subpulchrella TaxID=1486046 RepID=UPI0018A15C24|nr:guanine nucleotide-binding protein subunit beta-2 [Drosophila subpulchrella]